MFRFLLPILFRFRVWFVRTSTAVTDVQASPLPYFRRRRRAVALRRCRRQCRCRCRSAREGSEDGVRGAACAGSLRPAAPRKHTARSLQGFAFSACLNSWFVFSVSLNFVDSIKYSFFLEFLVCFFYVSFNYYLYSIRILKKMAFLLKEGFILSICPWICCLFSSCVLNFLFRILGKRYIYF